MDSIIFHIRTRIILLLVAGLCLASPVMAFIAPFTEVTAITDSLTGVSNSSAAWGDYDNDGDLDIILAGSYVAKIYRNDSGTFVDIDAGLTGVTWASVAWGDYDNDGDLDIVLTGLTTIPSYISKIYRNDAGSFVDIEAGLPGRVKSSVAWGDYDNDGDLDILLGGSGNARIYRNDGGDFTDSGAFFSQYDKSAVAWADFDNDGDLDVFVTGLYKDSQLYVNEGGNFDYFISAMGSLVDAAVAWGDYDNDGYLDILMTGWVAGGVKQTSLLKNNAGASFSYVSTILPDVEDGSVAWGDYDNDGDLDILLTGFGSAISEVYRNDAGTFVDIDAGLSNVSGSSVAWGDYDNDGALDILLTGSGIAKVFANNGVSSNTAPTAPTGLQSVVNQDSVQLTWSIATDTEPDAGGLSYNLRVGTSTGGGELMSAHANGTTGYRLIPALGNAQENLNGWNLNNLPDGTIYWSVQSIDHALAGSAFAAEQTFEIAVPPAAPQNLALGYYYDIGAAPLRWNQNTEGDFLRYRIYMDTSAVPTILVDSVSAVGDTTITITGLTVGTPYYFRITAVDTGLRESVDYSNEVTITPALYSLKTDSLALVDLYIATDSTNWTVKWDLDVALVAVTSSVSTWDRVTITDGRVAQIKLYTNNLSGTIPSSIGDLVNLTVLRLEYNQLTAIPDEITNLNLQYLYLNDNQLVDLPDLSSLDPTPYPLRVQNNKLTFEDIEPNITTLSHYSPQDSVGAEEDVTVEAGDNLTLSVSVGGSVNQYQWYRDGSTVSGATDDTLTLDPVGESDAGDYVCRIKNTIATALTLYSRPKHVTVTAATRPAAPQNLVAVAAGEQVTLTWSQNAEANFLRYRIYGDSVANPTALVDSTGSISETTKVLTGLTVGTPYYFRLTAVDTDLIESFYSNEVSATPLLSVSNQAVVPSTFALRQNYPNPFNPSTTVEFDVPQLTDMAIIVFDLLGRKVITLVNGQVRPGYHRLVWNGNNASGGDVPTGMYIARLMTPDYTKSIKMVLLK